MPLLAPIALVTLPSVWAYIGPGLAGGALTAILGSLGAILMLLVGAIWYPLQRVIRYFRPRGSRD